MLIQAKKRASLLHASNNKSNEALCFTSLHHYRSDAMKQVVKQSKKQDDEDEYEKLEYELIQEGCFR